MQRTAFPALVVVLLLALSGCSTLTPADATTPAPAPTRSAATVPSAGPTASTPEATTGPTSCRGDDLEITIEAKPEASGAGSFYSVVTFTNTGDPCTLEGPPRVFNLVDEASGAVVGKRGEDEGSPEVVVLPEGGAAYSIIHFTNPGAYDCDTATADAASVAAPQTDSAQTVKLATPIEACVDPATYSASYLTGRVPL